MNNLNISTFKGDGRNLHTFEKSENKVMFSKFLHGVNLGYITHLIILNFDNLSYDKLLQTVGRCQRLSRKSNLKVYIAIELKED